MHNHIDLGIIKKDVIPPIVDNHKIGEIQGIENKFIANVDGSSNEDLLNFLDVSGKKELSVPVGVAIEHAKNEIAHIITGFEVIRRDYQSRLSQMDKRNQELSDQNVALINQNNTLGQRLTHQGKGLQGVQKKSRTSLSGSNNTPSGGLIDGVLGRAAGRIIGDEHTADMAAVGAFTGHGVIASAIGAKVVDSVIHDISTDQPDTNNFYTANSSSEVETSSIETNQPPEDTVYFNEDEND